MSAAAILNHYSYAIPAALVLLLVAVWALRRATPRRIAAFAVIAIALTIPSLYLRAAGTTAGALDAALASGRPTLLEIYSPY